MTKLVKENMTPEEFNDIYEEAQVNAAELMDDIIKNRRIPLDVLLNGGDIKPYLDAAIEEKLRSRTQKPE